MEKKSRRRRRRRNFVNFEGKKKQIKIKMAFYPS